MTKEETSEEGAIREVSEGQLEKKVKKSETCNTRRRVNYIVLTPRKAKRLTKGVRGCEESLGEAVMGGWVGRQDL